MIYTQFNEETLEIMKVLILTKGWYRKGEGWTHSRHRRIYDLAHAYRSEACYQRYTRRGKPYPKELIQYLVRKQKWDKFLGREANLLGD